MVTECVFEDNSAPDNGGAIYIDPTFVEVLITSCRFSRNSAAQGGSIYAGNPTTIINSTFAYNREDAVYIEGSTNTVVNVVGCGFEDSDCISPNSLSCELGQLMISDSVFDSIDWV